MGPTNLTHEEQQLLIEILEGAIPDLRDEIRHTHNPDYRNSLKEREKRIKDLLGKLRGILSIMLVLLATLFLPTGCRREEEKEETRVTQEEAPQAEMGGRVGTPGE